VLYRPLYRGEEVWNRSRKRNTWGQVEQKDRPESEWLRRPAPELRVVDDALWEAAHARLAESRALYLRDTKGKVWGHPARGTESKYLLVGLARCGVCRSGLSVRTRGGKPRYYYYVCTGYHMRGRHVCSNRYELPMEDTNAAVLTAVGKQVLSPEMLAAAIDRATERLTVPRTDDDEAERLRREQRTLDAELSRLTGALAEGGSLRSVLTAIREREAKRERLAARLDALTIIAARPKVDRRAVREELKRRIEDWRAPLTQHVAQARQLLRKVLADRLTVTPEAGDEGYAAITGDGTFTKILAGIVFPKGMASPAGFDTCGLRRTRMIRAA
jgi:hypothetical protein